MTKQDFIQQLSELTSNENVLAVSRDVNELRTKFEDFLIEETRQRQVAELEAKERGETPEEAPTSDVEKDEFYGIFSEYKEKRKAIVEERNNLEAENLKKKRALISKLKELVENEEHIGAAFGGYKEIHESWKAVGEIPRDKRQDIQNEYSRLLEDFFYNMKIYREIKEYDLKKNLDLKLAVIEKIKELEKITKIKEVESKLKALQNDWEEIGPATQDKWEEIKEAYWSNVKAVWERIRAFYDERKEQFQANLDRKKELLVVAKEIVSRENETTKDWDTNTKELIALQNTWKEVGFGPKKENEEVWQEFRAECDTFFEAKSKFYEGINEVYEKAKVKKEALITKVEALKDSTDWKETTQKIIQLQKDWKACGNAGNKNEQSLWKKFRGSCDSFFNAKQKHFDDMDKQNEVNLTAKEEIISKIKAYTPNSDVKQTVADLKAFSQSFNEAGKVPFKEKDRIWKEYKDLIDGHYAKLKVEGAEKEKIMFQAKIDSLAANPDPSKAYAAEKQHIRTQIDKLKQDVIQYENNLGFFANSKGANALKDEVEKNIKGTKNKMDALIRKLKMIPNE